MQYAEFGDKLLSGLESLGAQMAWQFGNAWRQAGLFAKGNQWQLMLFGTIISVAGFVFSWLPNQSDSYVDLKRAEASKTIDALKKSDSQNIEFYLNDDSGESNISSIKFLRDNIGRELDLRIFFSMRGNIASEHGFQDACKIRHKGVKLSNIFADNFFGRPIAVPTRNFDETEFVPEPDDCRILLIVNAPKHSRSFTDDGGYHRGVTVSGIFRVRFEGYLEVNETIHLDQVNVTHVRVH